MNNIFSRCFGAVGTAIIYRNKDAKKSSTEDKRHIDNEERQYTTSKIEIKKNN